VQWYLAEMEYWGGIETAYDRGRAEVAAEKDAVIAEKDAALADKDAVIADQAALIAQLQARLGEGN
jgi:hypothetical protein